MLSAIALSAALSNLNHSNGLQDSLNTAIISPAIGSTNVKPNATVSFKINNTQQFNQLAKGLAKGQNYVTLGNAATVTVVPKSQITVDSSTQTVTINLAQENLARYTQYDVALYDHPITAENVDSSTIVTQVTSTDATLLNGVVVPLSRIHGTPSVGQWLTSDGSQWHVNNQHHGVDTLFTTGSAIGEPINYSVSSTTKSSVINVAKVSIQATDSYGDPATQGSVILSASGNASVNTGTQGFVNGKAVFRVTDHKAQTVSYVVAGHGKYKRDNQSLGVSPTIFVPGPTAQVNWTPMPHGFISAGQKVVVTGTATDIYENAEPFGTVVGLKATNGALQNANPSTNAQGQISDVLVPNASGGPVSVTGVGGASISTIAAATPNANATLNTTTTVSGTTVTLSGTTTPYAQVNVLVPSSTTTGPAIAWQCNQSLPYSTTCFDPTNGLTTLIANGNGQFSLTGSGQINAGTITASLIGANGATISTSQKSLGGMGVSSTSFTGTGRNTVITINGNDFGTLPQGTPFTGDTIYMGFNDLTNVWGAGAEAGQNMNAITINIAKWTNTEIVINGFGNAYGLSSNWVLNAGDKYVIWIVNPQTGKSTSVTGFVN